MEPIVPERYISCQNCKQQLTTTKIAGSLIPDSNETFEVPRMVSTLASNGFTLVPGLTRWLDILSPINRKEAWESLGNKNVLKIIRSHPKQQRRFFLNDSCGLDKVPQLGLNFEVKKEKTHLTLVENNREVIESPLLPESIRSYLAACNDFLAFIRDLFGDLLPTPTLPAILKLRIFEYHASDVLAGMRLLKEDREAMRPHVDGSICTLIIAESDGLLRLLQNGRWNSAVRPCRKPFAAIIPGVAAAHDYGIAAAPHMVLAGSERRISLTVFLTPALAGNRRAAKLQLAHWRFAKQLGSNGELSFAE
jgi:hypothetical protein